MESKCAKRPSHKEWRRIAKKERRKRLRQKAARERDQETEQLQKLLDANVDYLQWLEEQNKIKEEEERREAEKHAELEKAWIVVEVKVQKEWEVLQLRKAKARELQIAQEEIIIKEFEEMQENSRKKKEAERRRRDEQKKMFDRMKKEIDAYIDDGSRTPKALRSINETQPGKEICPFFNKTGACRYGDICSRNHQRPSLSTVILVPNFYTHFSLERHSHDYDSDIRLEYDHRETRNHFRDFYFDVVPELEKFGKIKTLQYCKNTESHLRGNLYVEYCSEREAARALRGLKGRWYAGRQLHCEFVNLKSWRGAICGMMRCPKGSACNFLHTFRNPTEDYGVKSPPLWQKRQEQFDRNPSSSSRRGNFSNRRSNWEDHDNGGQDRSRNWRWSESPEQDDRRQGGRSNQFRGQRNYYPRNQFNNRNNYDNNRRNDNRNFYNNRRPRNFNDNRHNRFSDEERDDNRFNKPQRRQFNNFNERFNKRRYSDSDGYEDYGSSKIRRKEKRSRSRSRSRGSRSRSMSRSPSRSRSRSRGSRSRSHSRSRSRSMTRSKSHSRSLSRSISRSRTRSRSPHPESMIEVDSFPPRKPTSRDMHSAEGASRSVSRERKRRPPSPLHAPKEKTQPKVSHKDRDDVISVSSSNSNHMFGQKGTRKPPTQHVSKWDNEKREDSSTESRDSRSRSRSASPYKEHHLDDIESSMPPQKPPKMQKMQHSHQYSKPPSGNSKGSNQKEYEWDTTESENE